MIFAAEKAIKDLGDKVNPTDRAAVEAEIENVKKVKDGDDVEAIRAASEKLAEVTYKLSEELYKQAQAQQGQPGADAGAGQAGGQDGNTVDAEYEVQDDK